MKKRYLHTLSLIFVCAIGLTSCDQEQDIDIPTFDEVFEISEEYLSLSFYEAATADEDKQSVLLYSTGDWEAFPVESWIHCSQSKGSAGDGEFFVTLDANTYNRDREGTIAVISNDEIIHIAVTQDQNIYFYVPTDPDKDYDRSEQSFSFEIETNIIDLNDLVVDIYYRTADTGWLTVHEPEVTSNGAGVSKLLYVVDMEQQLNEDLTKTRSAYITFYYQDLEGTELDQFVIRQS